jgi:hypothetical protein
LLLGLPAVLLKEIRTVKFKYNEMVGNGQQHKGSRRLPLKARVSNFRSIAVPPL